MSPTIRKTKIRRPKPACGKMDNKYLKNFRKICLTLYFVFVYISRRVSNGVIYRPLLTARQLKYDRERRGVQWLIKSIS